MFTVSLFCNGTHTNPGKFLSDCSAELSRCHESEVPPVRSRLNLNPLHACKEESVAEREVRTRRFCVERAAVITCAPLREQSCLLQLYRHAVDATRYAHQEQQGQRITSVYTLPQAALHLQAQGDRVQAAASGVAGQTTAGKKGIFAARSRA